MKKNHNKVVAKFAETSKIGLAGIFAGVFCIVFCVIYTVSRYLKSR